MSMKKKKGRTMKELRNHLSSTQTHGPADTLADLWMMQQTEVLIT